MKGPPQLLCGDGLSLAFAADRWPRPSRSRPTSDGALWKIEWELQQNYGPVTIGLQAQAGNTNPGGTMTRKADKKVWFITGAK